MSPLYAPVLKNIMLQKKHYDAVFNFFNRYLINSNLSDIVLGLEDLYR